MLFLRGPEGGGLLDLGGNGASVPFFFQVKTPLGGLSLILAVVVNTRPILRPEVLPLAVDRRRVDPTEEDAEELFIRHVLWAVVNRNGLGMTRRPGTDGAVTRPPLLPPGISHGGMGHTSDSLERKLQPPEAPPGVNKIGRF